MIVPVIDTGKYHAENVEQHRNPESRHYSAGTAYCFPVSEITVERVENIFCLKHQQQANGVSYCNAHDDARSGG